MTFQIVELAVALWFPCCLWNCMQPETLWILNPRRILKKKKKNRKSTVDDESNQFGNLMIKNNQLNNQGKECWICYDNDKSDVLIQPCSCKGDVSIVHHECLKLWLMESNLSTKNIKCKVCNEYYQLSKGEIWLPNGLELNHYLKSFAVFFVMGSTVFSCYLLVRIYDYGYIRTISVGVATLIEYICLKILGVNLLSAYHKAKFAAIIIKGKIMDDNNQQQITNRFNKTITTNQINGQDDQISTAHLSTTSELTTNTSSDDYSYEDEDSSLNSLNGIELNNQTIEPSSFNNNLTNEFNNFNNDEFIELEDDNHPTITYSSKQFY